MFCINIFIMSRPSPGPARPTHTRPRPVPSPMCLNCFQPRPGPGPQYIGPGPARLGPRNYVEARAWTQSPARAGHYHTCTDNFACLCWGEADLTVQAKPWTFQHTNASFDSASVKQWTSVYARSWRSRGLGIGVSSQS